MSASPHWFYRFPAEALLPALPPCPPELMAEIWRPTAGSWLPPGVSAHPFLVWTLFHRLRLFANRDYAVVLLRERGTIVHRSCLFPGYFRFPFMRPADLQVGDTWTAPSCRGRGLAVFGLLLAVREARRNGSAVWYLCGDDNPASARVAEKAGFARVGSGRRTRRLGLRALGAFVLDRAE